MMEQEERIVADRLEDIPTPSEVGDVVGHREAQNHFAQSYHQGQLHHAWLISGPKGIGKASLAFSMARHILSHPDHRDAPTKVELSNQKENVIRQIAQGAHPELLHLTRAWNSKSKKFMTQLSVEEVRRTLAFYGMTAAAGGWRITIVDAADDMNASAANAVLKILEEPPAKSLFFVLSHSPGRLLPTIRSRCQSLPLKPLSQQEVGKVLNNFNVSNSGRLAELAEGSARQGIILSQSSVINDFATFEGLMDKRATGTAGDWLKVHKIADNIARRGAEDSFSLFQDLVLGWLARHIRSAAGRGLPALASWAQVWDNAGKSATVAEAFNLDKRQVILSLFADFFACNQNAG